MYSGQLANVSEPVTLSPAQSYPVAPVGLAPPPPPPPSPPQAPSRPASDTPANPTPAERRSCRRDLPRGPHRHRYLCRLGSDVNGAKRPSRPTRTTDHAQNS